LAPKPGAGASPPARPIAVIFLTISRRGARHRAAARAEARRRRTPPATVGLVQPRPTRHRLNEAAIPAARPRLRRKSAIAMRRRDLLAGTALWLLLAASAQARSIAGALPWEPHAGAPPVPVKPG